MKQGKLKMIGKAKPDKPFNLPVHSIYTQTKEILFCPEKYKYIDYYILNVLLPLLILLFLDTKYV